MNWGAESKGSGGKSKIKACYYKEIALNGTALKSAAFLCLLDMCLLVSWPQLCVGTGVCPFKAPQQGAR